MAVTVGLVAVLVGCTGRPVTSDSPGPPRTSALSLTTAPTTTAPNRPTTVAASEKPSSVPPAAAHNFELAADEARRLLSIAHRPPSATPATTGPATLSGPAVGGLASTSTFDFPSFFTVPMSQAEAATWVSAHPPAGLVVSAHYPGTAPSQVPVRPVIGYRFSEADTSAWTGAGLDVTVAAVDAHTSLWRVEGTATWLDPMPTTDDQSGPRLRVTVAAGCPGSDRNIVGVSNSGIDLSTGLLPSKPPTEALICSYAGSLATVQARKANGPGSPGSPDALAGHHLISAATAQHLADLAARVTLAYDSGGLIQSCAGGDGNSAIIAFAYANRPDVDLWLDLASCPEVSNGRIRAWTAAMPLSADGIIALQSAALAARS